MANQPADDSEGQQPSIAQSAKPATPRSGILLVIIFGFVMMVSTPLITYLLVKATVGRPPPTELPEPAEDQAPSAPRPTPETIIDVEPVVVNIDGTQGTRYLKLAVQLVVSEARLALELKDVSRKALVKDRIIASAGNKSISDLEGDRGRETLKREIIQRLNTEFGSKMNGAVIDVYFSEYLIQ